MDWNLFWFWVLVNILQFLGSLWISARLQNSIAHEYDKHLVDYQKTVERNEKAAKIAELFAAWITPLSITTEESKRENAFLLTKLSFELALWIPDEELVRDVMKRLVNAGDAKDIKDIILSCRELIQGGVKPNNLQSGDIIHFNYIPS